MFILFSVKYPGVRDDSLNCPAPTVQVSVRSELLITLPVIT